MKDANPFPLDAGQREVATTAHDACTNHAAKRRLPTYSASAPPPPRSAFEAVRAKEVEIAADVDALDLADLRSRRLLSANAKTIMLVATARRLLARHPHTYLSLLRTSASDDTRCAAIVFNEKHTEGLPFHLETDCPVDAGMLDLGNIRRVGGTACIRCRKCFTGDVLVRQRRALHTNGVEGTGEP